MEVNGQIHASATLPIGQRASGPHWIEGWVGPRVGLDAVVETRNSFPCQKSNLGRLARSVVSILTDLSGLPFMEPKDSYNIS
jgi:hypothetical protein